MQTEDRLSRRSHERHRLTLRAELEPGVGVTRDISAAGVYFACDRPFNPGAAIAFTVVLDTAGRGSPFLLRCRGRVVRVEAKEDGRVGVAATIERFTVESLERPAATDPYAGVQRLPFPRRHGA